MNRTQLRFVYFYKNPRKNLRETTLNFAGHTNLSFSEAALSSTFDPYQIWEKQGLSVEVILTQ